MNSEEKLRKNKLNNLEKNPFQINKFFRNTNAREIIEQFADYSREELEIKNKKVIVAGRIIKIREFKRSIFANLTDQENTIQLMISENKEFKEIDVGDIIGVEGTVTKSQKGELSIKLNKFSLLSKCLKPLPDAYYGFDDIEERFRKRYLDFIINSEKRKIFLIRHKIIQNIRKFFDDREFIEIETPILVAEASGAQAKPFITHHNKLHRDYSLRIALEIFLKTLVIGGF